MSGKFFDVEHRPTLLNLDCPELWVRLVFPIVDSQTPAVVVSTHASLVAEAISLLILRPLMRSSFLKSRHPRTIAVGNEVAVTRYSCSHG